MKAYRRPRSVSPTTHRLALHKRRAAHLRLLYEVSHQLAAAHEAEAVLDAIMLALSRLPGYHAVGGLVVGDRLVLRTLPAADAPAPYPQELALEEPGLLTWVVRHAAPALVGDAAGDARCHPHTALAAARSHLAVPLLGQSSVLGTLGVWSDQPRAFDSHDLNLLEALAEYGATAITSTQLWHVAAEQHRELEALQSISLEIGGEFNLDVLLQTIVQSTASAFNADAAAVLTAEYGGQSLKVRSSYNMPELYTKVEHVFIQEARELFEKFGSDGVVELPFVHGDRVIRAEAAEHAGFAATATCRLIVDGMLIGVLNVYSCALRRFSASERRLLGALGQQAAMAISNAQRYQHERLLAADLEHSYDDLLQTLTELQRKEEQLNRTARLRALGELASGVAHDFNNLLAAILGNAELLLLDERDPDRCHMLGVIEQAAQDGAATVRRIQEFARKSEDRVHDLVNLTEVIDGALAITRTRWHDSAHRDGHPIHVRREIHGTPMVLGNASELRELLINLIINAVDAMPHGGHLTLRLDEQLAEIEEPAGVYAPFRRRLAVIEVADSGIGIPPEIHERVFDSFFSTKSVDQGSGLGLAICQNIANRHGGRIELHSVVGVGTTFRVLLPINDSQLSQSAVAPPTAAATCRVLVVDDDPAVRDVLARILQRGGHRVTTAVSGEEALAVFTPGQYDLLFTDLGMPGMGGAALLDHLRAIDPYLVAVVITGWGQLDDARHNLLGAMAVVPKPFSASRITELVGELARFRAV